MNLFIADHIISSIYLGRYLSMKTINMFSDSTVINLSIDIIFKMCMTLTIKTNSKQLKCPLIREEPSKLVSIAITEYYVVIKRINLVKKKWRFTKTLKLEICINMYVCIHIL